MPIKCEFCGMEYENPPGKFCDNCGRVLTRLTLGPMEEEPQLKRCMKCGHRNAADVRICINCGELLYTPQI